MFKFAILAGAVLGSDPRQRMPEFSERPDRMNRMSGPMPRANRMSEYSPMQNRMSEYSPTANGMSEFSPMTNRMSEFSPMANRMSEFSGPAANQFDEFQPTMAQFDEFQPTMAQFDEFQPSMAQISEVQPSMALQPSMAQSDGIQPSTAGNLLDTISTAVTHSAATPSAGSIEASHQAVSNVLEGAHGAGGYAAKSRQWDDYEAKPVDKGAEWEAAVKSWEGKELPKEIPVDVKSPLPTGILVLICLCAALGTVFVFELMRRTVCNRKNDPTPDIEMPASDVDVEIR